MSCASAFTLIKSCLHVALPPKMAYAAAWDILYFILYFFLLAIQRSCLHRHWKSQRQCWRRCRVDRTAVPWASGAQAFKLWPQGGRHPCSSWKVSEILKHERQQPATDYWWANSHLEKSTLTLERCQLSTCLYLSLWLCFWLVCFSFSSPGRYLSTSIPPPWLTYIELPHASDQLNLFSEQEQIYILFTFQKTCMVLLKAAPEYAEVFVDEVWWFNPFFEIWNYSLHYI